MSDSDDARPAASEAVFSGIRQEILSIAERGMTARSLASTGLYQGIDTALSDAFAE